MTKTIILLVIILTGINSFFTLSSAASPDYSFNIPSEFDPSSDLEVFVSAQAESTYDLKIFFSDQDVEIPGLINLNGQWENYRYYVQDINFKDISYKIKLKDPTSSTDPLYVCVRLRDYTSTSTPTKKCLPISMQNDADSSEKDQEKLNVVAPTPKPSYSEPLDTLSKNETSEKLDPIILTSKSQEKSILTNSGKSRIIINLFISFITLIALYLILKSESEHREI